MQQDHADLGLGQVPVAAGRGAHEVVDLGHRLDAREAAAGHDERQQRAAHLRIALDVGLLERVDEPVPYGERVAEVLERERVLGEAVLAGEAGHVAQRDDEMVEGQIPVLRAEPGGHRHAPTLEVDLLDRARVEVRGRAEPADRGDRVEEADAPRDHFRQHGLEDHVVLAADQPQLHRPLAQLAREALLEGERGVHAAEAAPQDQDACRLRRLHASRPPSSCQARSVSATLHAWAMQPRGSNGASPSQISAIEPRPSSAT